MPEYNRHNTFSPTALKGFAQCPHQFYLKNLAHVQPIYVGIELRRGTAVHTALSDYGNGMDWTLAKEAVIYSSPEDDRVELALIFSAIEKRRGNPPNLLPVNGKDVLIEKSLMLDENGKPTTSPNKAVVGNTLDLISFLDDGYTAWITDWKTTRRPEFDETLENDFQVRSYCYAVSVHFPNVQRIIFEKDYVRHGWGSKKAEFAVSIFAGVWNETVHRTAPIFNGIKQVVSGVQAIEAFPAYPTELCGWCGVRAHCPCWQTALTITDPGIITTQEQAEKLATMIRPAKKLIEVADVALRGWIEANGSIEINKEVLDFHPSKKTEVDMEKVLKVLQKRGMTLARYDEEIDALSSCDLGDEEFQSAQTRIQELIEKRKSLVQLYSCTKTALEAFSAGDKVLMKELKEALVETPTPRFAWKKV